MYAHQCTVRRGEIPNNTNTFLYNKINSILKDGKSVRYSKIFRTDDEQELNETEINQIAMLRQAGIVLCNLTDGGDGAYGMKHTEEHKRYISQLLKGRPKSLETIARIRLAKKINPPVFSEECRKKISEANRGKIRTKKFKRDLSKRMKLNNPMSNPEYRRRQKEGIARALAAGRGRWK
jgi:hypothetical protein